MPYRFLSKAYSDALLGKIIDNDLLSTFNDLGIDSCGENGEYHTFVIDGPLHKTPIDVDLGAKLYHQDYAFIDLI